MEMHTASGRRADRRAWLTERSRQRAAVKETEAMSRAEQNQARRRRRAEEILALLADGNTMFEVMESLSITSLVFFRLLQGQGVDVTALKAEHHAWRAAETARRRADPAWRQAKAERTRAQRQQRAQEILAMLEAGDTISDVARKIGRVHEAVYYRLQAGGVSRHQVWEIRRKHRAREILAMIDLGNSAAEVARQVGISEVTVWSRLRAAGVDVRQVRQVMRARRAEARRMAKVGEGDGNEGECTHNSRGLA